MNKPVLTQKRLKELLHYDPLTGLFTNVGGMSGRGRKGTVSGCMHDGYVDIKVDGKSYKAHRLAFLFMEGYFPEYCVDHKKGIRHDNRWKELRHATPSCNSQNQKIRITNSSGYPGASWHKKRNKWAAKGRYNKKLRHLGYHETKLDAALARLTWEVQCPDWHCNNRGELVKAIKAAWPEFNERSLNMESK